VGTLLAMNISGIIALTGVLLIVLGFLGLVAVFAVPGVPLIVLGVICLVVSAFVGGGFRGRVFR
jgi:membrane-bound ClpP family serine protease